MSESRPARTVGTVMIIMLAGKLLGLARTVTTASFLGTSAEMDAFTQASLIPRGFLDFAFASAISSSFIPVFSDYLENRGRDGALRLADSFVTLIFALSAAASVIMILFAEPLARMFAPGFSDDKIALTADLLRVMLPTICATALAFSVTGVLQSLGEFNVPAAMSVVSNVIVIAYMFLFMDRFGVVGLAWAFLIGWGTQLLIQLPPLFARGYVPRPRFAFADDGMKRIGRLALPVMVSSWVFPINTLVGNSAVSAIESGQSALGYAGELYSVVTGVFILSVANVVFPALSRSAANADEDGFGGTLRGTLRALFFLLPPMTAGMLALGRPIVELFYQRGSFDERSAELTVSALVMYVPGMLGFGVMTILSRAFYAEGSGKAPLLTGVAAVAANAALAFPLAGAMGVGGAALAATVSITLTAAVTVFVVKKKHPDILDKSDGLDLIKSVLLSAAMGGLVWRLSGMLTPNGFAGRLAALAGAVAVGCAAFMAGAYALGIKEARMAYGFIKRGRGK